MNPISLLYVPLLVVSCSFGQQMDSMQQPPSLHQVMSRAMESTQPVSQHELLTDLAGEWSYVTLMSMPQMPPLRGSGTTSIKPILGGRFIEITSTSTERTPPVESVGMMGFDSRPGHGHYFMLWLDSMGHYYTDAIGTWNPGTASLTFNGKETDPATGQSSSYRQVFRFPSLDMMTCDVFVSVPGNPEEMQILTVVYTRHDPDSATQSASTLPAGDKMRSTLGIGRAMDRVGSATPSGEPPQFTAEQIESMDRVGLQQAMLRIMRARTMTDIEDAARSGLDTQYELAMTRMRSLGAERRQESGLDREGQPAPPRIPSFSPQEIDLMDSGDAREALSDIAGARRNPDLSPEQKRELQALFLAVYQQLKDVRASQARQGGGITEDE